MSFFSISFMLSGLCASASEGLSDVLSSGISQEISAGGTESGGILAVQYLFYFLIIILGIVFLTLFRRRVSRGLTCAAVKEKCLTLKKLLEETLDSSGRKKKKSGTGFCTRSNSERCTLSRFDRRYLYNGKHSTGVYKSAEECRNPESIHGSDMHRQSVEAIAFFSKFIYNV